eukprot:COSAG02_NODE_5121_length_4612_cov_1.942167_2_plen_241_part_00
MAPHQPLSEESEESEEESEEDEPARIQSIHRKTLYEEQIKERTALVEALAWEGTLKIRLQSGSPSAAMSQFSRLEEHTVTLPKNPAEERSGIADDRTGMGCEVCGYLSKAAKRCNFLDHMRKHRNNKHGLVEGRPDLCPTVAATNKARTITTRTSPVSWLTGSQPNKRNYRDGLLTPLFAELAKERHEDPAYYETQLHREDLNEQIRGALRGNSACAHGINLCVWDDNRQQWFGTCKIDY